MRRLLFQLHALSSHCAVLPLVAAVFLLGAARIEGTFQGHPHRTAPVRALAGELGRMRADSGLEPDADADRNAAEKIDAWFRTRSR